jgi:hypothetical protein
MTIKDFCKYGYDRQAKSDEVRQLPTLELTTSKQYKEKSITT